MFELLFKNWWTLTVKGVLLIVFGLLALFSPGATFLSLILILAIFMVIDGVFSLAGVVLNRKSTGDKSLLLIEGIISLVLGIIVYRNPDAALLFVTVAISIWAIFSGVSKILIALQLRKEIKGEFWMILSGIISVIFGIVVFAQPGIAVVTLMWIIAVFALLIGITLTIISLKIRKAGKILLKS